MCITESFFILQKSLEIGRVKVLIGGNLTIDNVVKIKDRILPILNENDGVEFYLQRVDDIDLSIIQLLQNFKAYYKEKEVSIDSSFEENLSELVVNAGFKELLVKDVG